MHINLGHRHDLWVCISKTMAINPSFASNWHAHDTTDEANGPYIAGLLLCYTDRDNNPNQALHLIFSTAILSY